MSFMQLIRKVIPFVGEEVESELHIAVRDDSLDVAKLLIEKGADVNATFLGDSPLILSESRDMTELLIDKGADINATSGDHGYGWTKLHQPVSRDIAEVLIDKGADIEVRDSRGQTPLHMTGGDIAELLIEKGADINAKDDDGNTPLHTTVLLSRDKAELLIEKGADINAKNTKGHTPLHLAISSDDLWRNKHDGLSSLEWTKLFIDKGAEINAKDEDGNTPLHYKAHSKWNVKFSSESSFKARVDGRWNDERSGSYNATPLTHAEVLELELVEVQLERDKAELLIEKGADIEAKNKGGSTPLHIAALSGSGDIAKLLIDNGADIKAKDIFGSTPLHEVSILHEVSRTASSSESRDIAELLIEKGADINAQTNGGRTPLHQLVEDIAAHGGLQTEPDFWLDIAVLFIENGANIDAKDENGATPLKIGSEFEYSHPAWIDFTKWLVDKGADTSGIKLKFDL